MELSMASRRAITKAQAVRYRSASRAGKSEILDLVCAVTGFNRDYARRALKQALKPRVVKPRTPKTTNVRREGCGGAAEVLGGGERARG